MKTCNTKQFNYVFKYFCLKPFHQAIPLLGKIGAIQSGILFLSYTSSSLLGATYMSKKLGARNALICGTCLYCAYVGCFLFATLNNERTQAVAAVIGALVGGIGGGFIWTAQGSYFAISSEVYAEKAQMSETSATSLLGGIFAFIYLSTEVSLKVLSTIMLEIGYTWHIIFLIYFIVAVMSSFLMYFIYDYRGRVNMSPQEMQASFFSKVTAAGKLLIQDPKMKYMFGLNAAFGFSATFVGSYVSGEFEALAISDNDSKYIGVLSATTSCVAAVCSLLFGAMARKPYIGKGPILILGAMFFFAVGFVFFVVPDPHDWDFRTLLMIYSFQGIGRATFEGTLRATFADMFPTEKEGAFANIILQNGISSTLGYFFFPIVSPQIFEMVVMITSIFAIVGYLKAARINFRQAQRRISLPLMDEDVELVEPVINE